MRTHMSSLLLEALLFFTLVISLTSGQLEIPCVDFHPRLNFPCLCGLNDINATKINCDGVAFREFPVLPLRFYIQEFSQKNAGLQTLGSQLFTASDLPLTKVDFSDNQLRRVTERMFDGVEDTLEEIKLNNNLLGDNLNPVFSTGEFHNLKALKSLDLGHNLLTAIEEGLLDGCDQLKDLNLNGNKLARVPTESLRGPEKLTNLDLGDNLIERITPLAFSSQTHLFSVNLTNNLIFDIQRGAFSNMTNMVRLILKRNKISEIGDNVLADLPNLIELELSHNFLTSVPVQALSQISNLKFLNLGSNKIKTIKDVDLQALGSLEYLDLSRNLITEIMPGTFLGMGNLKGLDFSVNAMRKVEEDAFEGLESLEYLDISDNNVLGFPDAALGRLPNLKRLKADYNRIRALNYEILRSVKGLEELSLAYNIIPSFPEGTFRDLGNLKILNLYGNQIEAVDQGTFAGTEANLEYLDLGYNLIEVVEEISYPALKYLNLAKNKLRSVEGSFNLLANLNVLVLTENAIEEITPYTFAGMENLISIDMSKNYVRRLDQGVFSNNYLNEVNMSGNLLKELEQATFVNLPILEVLDLSHNDIVGIKNGAFDAIPRLKRLLLQYNRMSSYKGDFFANMDNDTDLHTLDMSYNELTYLYPESFVYHPQLMSVNFAHNKFSFFPTQFIRGLKQLKDLDLSFNLIKSVDDGDFSNLPRLKDLDLSSNEIESVSETAFQNSTQLQKINLSKNKVSSLKSDTFRGALRLLLDLSYNNLTDMPRGIFERKQRVMQLQYLDLSYNSFRRIPVDVLQSQYFNLDTLKIAHNRIHDIPSDANILVNIKEIDLSYNPLTEDSIVNVLNEPKTVRNLNMAGTGISTVPVLETPFLTHLNLSHNDISVLNDEILNKPTALESLDVSFNDIPNLSFGMTSAWPKLKSLRYLDISGNPITFIIKGDFKYLDRLKTLKMNSLHKCTKVERGAFVNLKALSVLELSDLPMVMFMDVRGILSNFQTLEEVVIDFKEPIVGDHFSPAYSPRLRKLGVKGGKVKNIAIRAFVGISSSDIDIMLTDTKISNIPTSIFFLVPLSSNVRLDVKGSRLSSLGPQLLNTVDNKQRHIKLVGLATNPIYCDCNARSLYRWLKEKTGNQTLYADLGEVRCAAPDILAGKLLAELPEEELTCEGRTTTTTTEFEFLAGNVSTTPYPDIITSSASDYSSTPRPSVSRKPLPTKTGGASAPYNMDALIIGIVGGVVAFIAIIIIIICIVRLRLTDSQYRGGPLAGPLALRAQGKCTCLKPVPPTLYGAASIAPPPPALSYPSTPVPPPHHPHGGPALALTWAGPPAGNGTVNSSKMVPPAPSIHGGSAFGTVGAQSYLSAVSRGSHHPISYPGTMTPAGYPSTPYYVTFPADSDGEGSPHPHHANGRASGHR